jgi:hypothetical protein
MMDEASPVYGVKIIEVNLSPSCHLSLLCHSALMNDRLTTIDAFVSVSPVNLIILATHLGRR